MKTEYILKNYKFEKLNQNHNLHSFSSESSELNDFLKNDALKQQECKLNLTYLVKCDNNIIGFFSILTDKIRLKDLSDPNTKSEIKEYYKHKTIPAVKLGRFAIDKKYSKKGIGTDVLINIINNINFISENYMGFRFITIEAYTRAYPLYLKNGFTHFKKDDEKIKKFEKILRTNPESIINLYLDLNKLKK